MPRATSSRARCSTATAIAILRPGTGIEVRDLDHVIGRTARRRIERHEPLAWDAL